MRSQEVRAKALELVTTEEFGLHPEGTEYLLGNFKQEADTRIRCVLHSLPGCGMGRYWEGTV